jgi:hypothetical protein
MEANLKIGPAGHSPREEPPPRFWPTSITTVKIGFAGLEPFPFGMALPFLA